MFDLTKTITLCDVELEVSYDYEPYIPHGKYEPGQPERIEIGPVMAGGVDIYLLLSDVQLQRIERAISERRAVA